MSTTCAAEYLKASAKSTAKKRPEGFEFGPGLEELAGKFLSLNRQKAELERELGLARDQILREVGPRYQDLLRTKNYEASIRVPAADDGVLRVTFQHRYLKLPSSKAQELQSVVGDRYDDCFRPGATVKVRKEIADDPDQLGKVVMQLAEALGDQFAKIFEAEQVLLPTRTFTEQRYRFFDDAANERLESAGVKSVVVVMEGK